MATLVYEYSHYFCSGIVPGPMGSGHLSLVPYNAYNTRQGWIVIGPSWPRLARVLNMEWMTDDPRFATQPARLEHKAEFDRLVQEKLMELPAEDWLELMHVEDIPAAPVNALDKVVANPQAQHRNMIIELDHALGGKVKMVGNPLKMPGSIDDTTYLAPPTLGQHNDEVLGDLLGYSLPFTKNTAVSSRAISASTCARQINSRTPQKRGLFISGQTVTRQNRKDF